MDIPPDVTITTPNNSPDPRPDAARERDPRFSVMATAACTSATVSLLTLWLWTPAPPAANDSGGTVSVTYESLDPERAQDGRGGLDTDTRSPVADAMTTRGDPGVAPASRAAARHIAADDEDLARVSNAPAASRISITTQPEGASVTINGVGYGTTPLSIAYLPPGAKRIRVTKAGYETEERYYSSDAARASALRIRLREISRHATR